MHDDRRAKGCQIADLDRDGGLDDGPEIEPGELGVAAAVVGDDDADHGEEDDDEAEAEHAVEEELLVEGALELEADGEGDAHDQDVGDDVDGGAEAEADDGAVDVEGGVALPCGSQYLERG